MEIVQLASPTRAMATTRLIDSQRYDCRAYQAAEAGLLDFAVFARRLETRAGTRGCSVSRSFIKGLDLSELFYREAVRPILASGFPGLTYSAALIGPGSEVLGLDTPQSMDHNWGPRLQIFLAEADHASFRDVIDERLRQELPREIRGFPTNFGRDEDGTAWMAPIDNGPVDHGVEILTVLDYFTRVLGFNPAGEIRAADWVGVPEYHLLMLTAGRVFYNGLRQLEPIRAKLSTYPDDVWLYLLAAQWARIGQEEAFVGRCGQVGDEPGSRLIAGRLVRDLMRLCFLMERKYAPYIKWFGSAFLQLVCAADLLPVFSNVLQTGTWEDRQDHLSTAYAYVAEMHNGLGITEPLATGVSQFHGRPFVVIHASRFADALRAAIRSEEVLALPRDLGSVDQFIDSTDAMKVLDRLREVYRT